MITANVRPRVVLIEQGSGYAPSEPGKIGGIDRGGCANRLTARLAQGPVRHDSLVQIEKHTGDAKPNNDAPIMPVSV